MPAMNDVFELSLFCVCLCLSGFYSGAEAALISISIDRAKQLLEAEGPQSTAMKFLIEKPNTVLTTILVGNNLVNILAASLVTVMAQNYFDNDAVAIATGVTTFLILIFGEIMPKTFARRNAETLAPYIIRILQANYYLLFPLIEGITYLIQAVLGKNAQLNGRLITKDDIEFMVNKAEKEKSMDSKQIDLLSSILEFPHIKVKDIMVHRKDVRFIENSRSFRDIIHVVRKHGHSRYPVVGKDLDDCVGFLHVKDLSFVTSKETDDFRVIKYLKPPFFVYEHMRIQAVFEYMNRRKVHLALVKDENGWW
jgi:putative hemolysin